MEQVSNSAVAEPALDPTAVSIAQTNHSPDAMLSPLAFASAVS